VRKFLFLYLVSGLFLQGYIFSHNLSIEEIKYGEWKPLRMQPTKSPSNYQHSFYISDYNLMTAKKIISGFEEKKEMLLISGKFGRLIISEENGLIQGMAPLFLLDSFEGSYLREYSPNWKKKGKIEIIKKTDKEIILRWKGKNSLRDFYILNDGIIKTKWKNGPENLEIYTGCFPYFYLATDKKNVVRFSQLIQKKRKIYGYSNLALFGYRDASLEIKLNRIKTVSEEIWLDSGEVGWEWVKENKDKIKGRYYKAFGEWFQKNASLTYLAGGGIRKINLKRGKRNFSIDYCIGNYGEKVIERIGRKYFKVKKEFEKSNLVSVKVKKDFIWTTRIWPNHFNGWKLRPLKLVQINPMPVFFKITLSNKSKEKKEFNFYLDKLPWIKKASIEYDPEIFKIGKYPTIQVPEYKTKSFWRKEKVSLTLNPEEEKNIFLRIEPIEETIGDYKFNLRWQAGNIKGNIPLKIRVKVCSLVDQYGVSLNNPEDNKYFGHTGWSLPFPHPLYFYFHYPGVERNIQDKYFKLAGEEALRNGYWIRDYAYLRKYITCLARKGEGFNKNMKEYFSLSPSQYVRRIKKDLILRKVRIPYRYRIYLADEIWEILGGYKGRHYMPLDEVEKMVYEIIKDSKNPCWFSFMQQGIDNNYHIKIPNDIAETFIYLGRDEKIHLYVKKLVKPRLELIKKWKKELKIKGKIRPMFSFWISGQLHVTDYETMRRQHWYTKFNGIDIIMFWRLSYADMVYANHIGCNSLLYAGEKKVIMTDRSLAWLDLKKDMELITLERFLKENLKISEDIKKKVEKLEKKAFEESQKNNFDLARDYLYKAILLLFPKYKYLIGPHYYTEIKSEKLPDLTEKDKYISKRPEKKKTVVKKLSAKHRNPPSIDGVLDNIYLEQGTYLNNFSLLDTFKQPKAKTFVYLTYDEENFYILFICNEPKMDKIVRKTFKRDGPVWTTDCVEIFFDRNRDRKTFMHFIIGASGSVFDSRKIFKNIDGEKLPVEEVKEWNPEYKWKVKLEKDSWIAEVSIPWSEIGGKPKKGETWGVNFARERKSEPELSIWSPQIGGFCDPQQFGEIEFH